MNAQDEALLKRYLNNNEELKELWTNHSKLNKKLEKYERKLFLTAEDKVEKKRLQLEKLRGKTRIEAILERYRKVEATHIKR